MRQSLLIALSTCLTVFFNTNVAAADSEPPVHLAAQHFLDRLPQMAAKQSRGIRWSTGRSGTITGIFGEPLGVNWHSQKIRTNRAASAQAALFFRSFGRAFGLGSGDIIRPIRTTSTASGAATEWTVSLARERDGLRVFNEGATVVIGTDGSLQDELIVTHANTVAFQDSTPHFDRRHANANAPTAYWTTQPAAIRLRTRPSEL